MFNIEFYQTSCGYSDVLEFLEELRQKAVFSKDCRIQFKQAVRYIQLLADNGTNLPSDIIKYLGNDIWELRPGINRVFFFYYDNATPFPKANTENSKKRIG